MIKNLNKIEPNINCPICKNIAYLNKNNHIYHYKNNDITCNRFVYNCSNCNETYTTTELETYNYNILYTEHRDLILNDLLD